MNYNIFFNAGIHLSDPLAHLVFLSVYWLNELDLYSILRKEKEPLHEPILRLGLVNILTWSYKAPGHVDLAPYIL